MCRRLHEMFKYSRSKTIPIHYTKSTLTLLIQSETPFAHTLYYNYFTPYTKRITSPTSLTLHSPLTTTTIAFLGILGDIDWGRELWKGSGGTFISTNHEFTSITLNLLLLSQSATIHQTTDSLFSHDIQRKDIHGLSAGPNQLHSVLGSSIKIGLL